MNKYRHFYLYAKNHYISTGDVIRDLKLILSNYCGLKPEHISVGDIITIFLMIVQEHIENNPKYFSTYISMLQNSYTDTKSLNTAIIRATLTMLALTQVRDDDKVLIELGEADPEVLEVRTDWKD